MTTQQTPTLATFLLAQIAADEAVAQGPPNTTVTGNGGWYYDQTLVRGRLDVHTCDEYASPLLHIDPAHVLATCAAHRAIVELHKPNEGKWNLGACSVCALQDGSKYGDGWGAESWPCETLRALATIYADRPGFDPAWVAS